MSFPKKAPSTKTGIMAALQWLYDMLSGGITNVYARFTGLIAHDDPDTAQNRPNKQGYKYEATLNPVSTDGDVSDGKCDQYGRQHVREVTLDGMAKADDSAFTVEGDKILPVGGIATTDEVNSGDAGGFGMTTHREQYVQPRSGGNAQTIDADGAAYATLRNGAAAIGDDPARPLSAQLSDGANNIGGAAASPLIAQLSDGAALIDTGQENMAASIPVVLPTDQSAIPTNATIVGTPDVDLMAVGGAAIDLGQENKAGSIPVTLASDEDTLGIEGDTAHDAADSGNPVKIGAKGVSGYPADVDASDRVNLIATLAGALVQAGYNFTYDSLQTLEQNDLAQQYDSPSVEHVDSAALADATYEYEIEMGAYSSVLIQAHLDSFSTLKIYQSIDDAGSPDYLDITLSMFDRVTCTNFNASYTNQNCKLELHQSRGTKIKIEVVVSGGGGAGTVQIHSVRSHGGV